MGSDGAEIRLIFYDTLCSTWNILAEDSSMCEGLHYTYSWRRVSMRNRLCKRNPRRIEAGNGRTEADSGRIWEDWGGEAPRPRFFIHSKPIGIKSSFFLFILIQSKSNHRHIIFDSDSISNWIKFCFILGTKSCSDAGFDLFGRNMIWSQNLWFQIVELGRDEGRNVTAGWYAGITGFGGEDGILMERLECDTGRVCCVYLICVVDVKFFLLSIYSCGCVYFVFTYFREWVCMMLYGLDAAVCRMDGE